ncbi:RHS repeat-associated core domain-containing protein [Halomonas sp. HNIBRBA4712]|uniref:RHS repeat-associated core domain-containing protein n=1 Tax=Halomonas sp. HNIBRBA4712 TaxID=3373087 RepID=UPI00374720DB
MSLFLASAEQYRWVANGAPQQSQFGDLLALNWHIYGSGHLHGLSAPELNLEVDLTPDALHRETQRRLSLDSSNQTQPLIMERGYTNLGQLDHLTLRGAQSGSQQYQYDALGRMSFRALLGEQSRVIAYSFDAAGRLTGSQHGDQAHRYAVDAAGNPLDGQQPVTDNRVTQHNGARYRYDGAGNMIERQQPDGERLTMGYDGANRLVSLTRTSPYGHTTQAAYRYDALGRRISKTVQHTNGTTATTRFGWDGDRIVREETDNQRSTIVYEPGSFVPMLRIDDTQQGQQLSAFVTDAIGTPMQLVAANGETRWQGQPDDWAAVKNVRGSASQPIRFQGQWHDEESGLYYNRHRYYDPQQGRYVSQDPIGLNGGTNLYGYVTNPMGAVDPLGLFENQVQTSRGGLGFGILAPRTMSHFAIHESDRNALEQLAGVRSTSVKTAGVGAAAGVGAGVAVLEGPAISAALTVAYRSPVGQCIKEVSQNVIFEAVTNMSDASPNMPDAKDLADENMRNRTEQMQRDTRPRPRIPDVLSCKR